MKIKTEERYFLGGVEYKSLRDVKTHIENQIGGIIDAMDVTLSSKQRLNILKGLVKNRDTLAKLLQVEYGIVDLDGVEESLNILDV